MMPKGLMIFVMFVLAAMLVCIGCSDRGTGVPTSSSEKWGIFPAADHSYDKDLSFQLSNLNEVWLGAMYIPTVAMPPPTGTSEPVPVLILLPPQDGDKFYYFHAGLFELAQEMIASGEIQPMVIMCPANAEAFGGFFYGNSMPAGRGDSIIGGSMISDYLRNRIPATIENNPSKRGIGGIGMGAYGAFRAALKHPGTFGSITVSDGPLDFDGANGTSGLISLFDDAMAEQWSIYPTADFDSNFTYNEFDSGNAVTSLPISRLFIGGGLAFSPHDTLVDWTYNSLQDYVINQKFSIDDSSTLISDLVRRPYNPPDGEPDSLYDFNFHLPFADTTGTGSSVFQPSPATWPLWMQNNLDSMHAQAGGSPLTGVNIWVAHNPDAKWNYYQMTESWIQTLEAQPGYTVQKHMYSGFDGPISGDEALYDLMQEMLIFHSESFGD